MLANFCEIRRTIKFMSCEECNRLARQVEKAAQELSLVDGEIGVFAGDPTPRANSQTAVLQRVRERAEDQFDKARVQLVGHQKSHSLSATDQETRDLLVATLKVELESGLLFAHSSRSHIDPAKALKAQFAARRCCEFVDAYLSEVRESMSEEDFAAAGNQLAELRSMIFWPKAKWGLRPKTRKR
jgi:hypothetical protein